MNRFGSVGVFCGSSSRVDEAHRAAARDLGRALARAGIRIVYGGGRVGLMGILADAALAAGGRVIGVIPEFLYGLEVAHEGLTKLDRVGSMHERKQRMFELSDAFISLSGGLGTLDETIEIVTWKQLGLHDKPLVIVNVGGLWNPLRAHLEGLIAAGFATPGDSTLFSVVDSIPEAFGALAAAPEPTGRAEAKWT
jgi:hypothetical protein